MPRQPLAGVVDGPVIVHNGCEAPSTPQAGIGQGTADVERRDPRPMAQPKRRRGPAWIRLGHAIWMPSGLEGREAMLAELRAWQALLPPSGVYTDVTAAAVHGLWMPRLPVGVPLFVAMGSVPGEVKPDRRRLAVTRRPTPPGMVAVAGVRVATVAEVILSAARFLPFLDLVVLIDSALHLGKVTLDELTVVASRRRRGVRSLRAALPYAESRSESAWETLLRLLHVVCGVDVEPQVELFDEYGAFVARADLHVVGTVLIQEYDGAQHREQTEQVRDLRRSGRLADIGVVRRGYTATDVLRHAHAILAAADKALGRSRSTSPSPWLAVVANSLYVPAGRRTYLAHIYDNWSHLADRVEPDRPDETSWS